MAVNETPRASVSERPNPPLDPLAAEALRVIVDALHAQWQEIKAARKAAAEPGDEQ